MFLKVGNVVLPYLSALTPDAEGRDGLGPEGRVEENDEWREKQWRRERLIGGVEGKEGLRIE